MYNQNSHLTTQSIVSYGFVAGAAWSIYSIENLVKYPLSTMFDCCIGGFFGSVGAAIVYDLVPEPFKIIVPITLGVSAVYYFAKSLKN